MSMQICFFEDDRIARFYPNALTRPLDQMRLGILTLAEKWTLDLAAVHVTRVLRPWLRGVFADPLPHREAPCLWINARLVANPEMCRQVASLAAGQGLTHQGQLMAACLDGHASLAIFEQLQQEAGKAVIERETLNGVRPRFSSQDVTGAIAGRVQTHPLDQGLVLEHAWDLFHHNADEIIADLHRLTGSQDFSTSLPAHAVVAEPRQVFTAHDVQIDAGAILDASEGPIYLGQGVRVMCGAMLRGPVAIGEHSIVRLGAKIDQGTSCGPHCRLGGEISYAIFQSHANKAHDGYIGNSLIGQWVNIGADTNNSNLKNNYSTVKVYDWESGQIKDTGLQFCGLFMADHCKTAINSMLNSGTVCGVSSSILTNNFPDKYIPSFGWVTDQGVEVFELNRALETARIMMARRGQQMTPAQQDMLRYLYDVRDGRLQDG